MIENWKNALDKPKKFGTVFMDLSKVFDTPNHYLLLSKANEYWPFFQCNKIKTIKFENNNFSEWLGRVRIRE